MPTTRAERRRAERERQRAETPFIDDGRRSKLWDRATLQKLLPRGVEPIGTRYDRAQGMVHVACADGTVHKFQWAQLEVAEQHARADEIPLIIDAKTGKPFEAPSPLRIPLPGGRMGRVEIMPSPTESGGSGSGQPQPSDGESAEPSEGEGDGTGGEGPNPDENLWEVAQARCAELELQHGKLNCGCNQASELACHGSGKTDSYPPCDRTPTVAMIDEDHNCTRDHENPNRHAPPVVCEPCATQLIAGGYAKLDGDPRA